MKPIDFSELRLRVRALLRRANIEASRKLTVGGLVLDADGLTAALDGVEIPVTTREFNILYKLLSYPNHAFSRFQLMDEFWGIESDTGLRAVDVYITKLRDKFSACPASKKAGVPVSAFPVWTLLGDAASDVRHPHRACHPDQ